MALVGGTSFCYWQEPKLQPKPQPKFVSLLGSRSCVPLTCCFFGASRNSQQTRRHGAYTLYIRMQGHVSRLAKQVTDQKHAFQMFHRNWRALKRSQRFSNQIKEKQNKEGLLSQRKGQVYWVGKFTGIFLEFISIVLTIEANISYGNLGFCKTGV